MREEILINVTPQETRVATLHNGLLQELQIERVKNRGISGNIYLGRVARVLPGMQAAFIEIGLTRTAFLHVRDLNHTNSISAYYEQRPASENIDGLLSEGQEILVQVVKDPIGSKGARLSEQVSIPARNLVYLPSNEYLGVSQRIKETIVRDALIVLLSKLRSELGISGGFIVRTAGEGATVDEIQSDMVFLTKTWNNICKLRPKLQAPELLYTNLH